MGKKSSARNEIPGFPVSPSLPLPTSLPNSTPALPSILSHLAASRASSSQLEGKEGGRERRVASSSSLPSVRSSSLLDLSGYLCCLSPAPTPSRVPTVSLLTKPRVRDPSIWGCVRSQSRKNPRWRVQFRPQIYRTISITQLERFDGGGPVGVVWEPVPRSFSTAEGADTD